MTRASFWNIRSGFSEALGASVATGGVAPERVAPHVDAAKRDAPRRAARRPIPLPHPRRWAARFPLGAVALVAAVASGVINLLLGADPYWNMDSHSFVAIARSLLAGTGFVYRDPMVPNLPLYAFRSPGYSAFLALGLALGGVPAVVALQGALHGVAAALVGSITSRWAGARGAWLAFAMYWVWPAAWFHAGQLMSESFFTFTIILTVSLMIRAEQHRRLRWAVAAGVVAAVAILVRPSALGCAVGAGSWLLLRYPRAAAVFALSAVLAWLPWPIRNAQRLHTFVPLLTSGGASVWSVHSRHEPIVAWTWMSRHSELGEVALDRHFADAARRIVRDNPSGLFRIAGRNLEEFSGPIRVRDRSVWLHRFAMLALVPALLWTTWRRRLLLPALVWGCEGLMLIPLAMQARYRFPTEWCVVVGAAIGLHAIVVRWGVRRTWVLAAAAMLACVVFTLVTARASSG